MSRKDVSFEFFLDEGFIYCSHEKPNRQFQKQLNRSKRMISHPPITGICVWEATGDNPWLFVQTETVDDEEFG